MVLLAANGTKCCHHGTDLRSILEASLQTIYGECNVTLFEIDQFMPHPIETVFALTVDLEKAPHWHSFFTKVEQVGSPTANSIIH